MKHFKFSIVFTIICLALAGYWGLTHGVNAGVSAMLNALAVTAILAVMEVSLSFDNAIVNASVLKGWSPFWKKLFLTVGILVAVFGMRLIFPIVIVSVTADMSMMDVVHMALDNPVEYSTRLIAHHAEISAFGGMFLLLVFLNFLFDDEKEEHWFHIIEHQFAKLAQVPAMSVFVALIALLVMAAYVPDHERLVVTVAGIWGIVVYIGVQVIGHLLEGSQEEAEEDKSNGTAEAAKAVVKGGIGGFII